MKALLLTWPFWALLSAAFAALTAIFAKVGVESINSDFATFIRTVVILAIIIAILTLSGEWQSFGSVSSKTYLFLILSGFATGASWLCYFRALKIGQAALARHRAHRRRRGADRAGGVAMIRKFNIAPLENGIASPKSALQR
jgi:hypothetical protein